MSEHHMYTYYSTAVRLLVRVSRGFSSGGRAEGKHVCVRERGEEQGSIHDDTLAYLSSSVRVSIHSAGEKLFHLLRKHSALKDSAVSQCCYIAK